MANKAEEWVGKVMWMSKDDVGAYMEKECGACSISVVVRRA